MKSKTAKKSAKPPQTLGDLARRLGVSRQLLAAHRKRPDSPALGDVEAWQLHLALRGREGSAPAHLRERIAQQRLALLTAVAGREKLRLAKDRKELIARSEVNEALAKGMAALFSAMDYAFNVTLPAGLKGLPEADIRNALLAATENFKGALRSALEKLQQAESKGDNAQPA